MRKLVIIFLLALVAHQGVRAQTPVRATAQIVKAQTGTSYAIVNSDAGKLLTFSNAGAVAVSIPQAGAGSLFTSGWFVEIKNLGAGSVTITPAVSTIGGNSTLVLTTGQSAKINSNGSNYLVGRIDNSVAVTGTPSSGQVPTATSATTATWQTVAAGEAITDVTKAPYNADKTGATDASAAIRSAIAAGAKRIYLPAGTYLMGQSQLTANPLLLQVTTANVEIFGDGPNLTIIKTPTSLTVGASTNIIDFLGGKDGSVHDLWIQGPTSVTGANQITGIASRFGSYRTRLYNLKFTNLNDNSTAGMNGISLYNPYNQAEYTTTLGTTIASGSRTVTPGSMGGIYLGRILAIGGTAENVTVTATTATTFTAVFANAHDAANSVEVYDDAYQGAIVENIEVRDSFKATAITVNSTGNTIRNFTAVNVGDPVLGTQHCFYVQAGNNLFERFWCEGIGGYGIHQYLTGGSVTPASGNKYDNGFVINAEGGVVLIDSNDTSNGSNPYYPSGLPLNRYTSITNSTFRNTYNAGAFSVITLVAPTYFDGNILEDVSYSYNRSPYSIVTSNNVSRRIFKTGTQAALTGTIGGGTKMFDALPESRVLLGQGAYPVSTGANRIGGHVDIVPGYGSNFFTALDNLSGAVSLTIQVLPDDGGNNFTLVSGVDFTLGSDNTAAQLAVTATNLTNAINNGNANQYVRAEKSGAVVYVVRMPSVGSGLGGVVSDAIIGTNQAGRISITSNSNGRNRVWQGLQWQSATKPTCNSTNRGTLWYVAGGAGVLDTFEVCRKDAADVYAWVSLF